MLHARSAHRLASHYFFLLPPANPRRSEKTVGGESFIITRTQGNVMVDAPRYNPVLAKRIQEMGGIQYIVLTHKCDTNLNCCCV